MVRTRGGLLRVSGVAAGGQGGRHALPRAGLDFHLPEEGDICTMLKYLAVVAGTPGEPPEAGAN